MEKGKASSLYVNDGSFMERFKQLQQEKGAAVDTSKPAPFVSGTSNPKPIISKTNFKFKANVSQKTTPVSTSGKLAFNLKQKAKLVAPSIKLSEDEDEEENDASNASGSGIAKRQKLDQLDASEQSLEQVDVAPPPPSDPTVKKVADTLASFVAKHGRQFEHITRQKNPGDTPFKFLFEESHPDYKYYEYRVGEEEKALLQARDSQTSESGVTSITTQRSLQQHSHHRTPVSAFYESREDTRAFVMSQTSRGGSCYDESKSPPSADPIAMMDFYMKKAAHEERMRQPKQSKDEMPPPVSFEAPVKKGHHMGDFIPPGELEKFLASCNDAAAQKAAKEAVERARIQADNVGHKLLSKMGWREGQGLGSSESGIADPIMAGNVKRDHLGVGAVQPGEVTPDDDIYEQYKKRMMLGYRYRPNPLNNPRKAYY